MHNVRVSVLIPTFNRAQFMKPMLTSIFAQTVEVHEVILVDDGSTDSTAQAVAEFMAEHPNWSSRLVYLRQENRGKSSALNLALSKVSADAQWIAFNDSDDLWHAEKLELQFQALASFPDCGACFTDGQYVNNPARTGTPLEAAGHRLPALMGRLESSQQVMAATPHGITMITLLVAATVMKKLGEFDPVLRVAQDADLMFRLALITPICYVNRPLVDIDRTPERQEGLTTKVPLHSLARLRLHEGMLLKWLGLVGEQNTEVRSIIEKRLEGTRSAMANQLVWNHEWREARQTLERALQHRFSWRLLLKRMLARPVFRSVWRN
jgi:glycosyltransferase involved in cell wall biosynthesis